jgi:hypothetical protein
VDANDFVHADPGSASRGTGVENFVARKQGHAAEEEQASLAYWFSCGEAEASNKEVNTGTWSIFHP